MRKINITTTQNVTIEYELATVADRTIATWIDLAIIYLGSLIVFGIVSAFTGSFNYLFISTPAAFFYHLLCEAMNHGQTLGKRIVKIRVVKITGERPGFFDFLMRTVFRFIDITLTLGSLAFITISSTEKGQRLGDFLADTTVVKLINVNRFSIGRILSMEKLKNYTPVYPGVVKFKEEEMLLIKETLDRFNKYPNDNHFDAREKLVHKIEEQLGIVAPHDRILFLKTLIKDYVSLTR
ncbi:MAG TPA: RDD family protein [Bacteroidales bacterium]|nr:RDD family protein [Bacteroidales bacterium]